jgi:opacity protein-like surface antigen
MKHTVAGVITLALGLMAGTAQAQTSAPAERPVTYGAAVGLNMPMGDAGDGLNMGFKVNGLVELHPQSMPVDFRGEIGYSRFGADGVDGHQSVLSFIPNVLYNFSTQSRIQPYLIGGVGLYHVSASVDAGPFGDVSVSDNKFGINVGGGLHIPLSSSSAALFVEARYHNVFNDGGSFNMLPITVGVTF